MAVRTGRATSSALAALVLTLLFFSGTSNGSKIDVGESKYWGFFGFNHTRPSTSSRIIVGGSQHWQFGFNYTDWVLKTGPFYKYDTLVFMYDPPKNGSFPHSVYLMRDYRSFLACDLSTGRMVGNISQGGGQGFEFVLRRSRPYYFACGEHDGIHCGLGMMKFPVFPFPFKRWPWHA